MRLTSLMIIALISLSCSKEMEPKDFFGKHTFYKSNKIRVKNKLAPKTTGTWFEDHPKITYYTLSPMELELFEADENITGKMLFTGYVTSRITGESSYKKGFLQASKFRLSGDTLLFELTHPDNQTFSYTTHLVKGDTATYVGLHDDMINVNESIDTLANHYVGNVDNYQYLRVTTKDFEEVQSAFLTTQIQLLKAEGKSEDSYDIQFLENQIEDLGNP